MIDPNELRLLREARAGKRDACVELVRSHYATVYRFLLHLTRDVPQAEDLTQDTFAIVWQRLAGFEGRSSFGTWLHRIAYGKFIDARRAGQREQSRESRPRESVGGDPEEAAALADDVRQVHAALDQLAAAERLLLVLHYLQGLSYREVAEVVGEPCGTVKWRISQALDRLRTALTAEVEP